MGRRFVVGLLCGVGLLCSVALVCPESRAANANARVPCLKPEAAPYVASLFAWQKTPAAKQVGPLGNIAVRRAAVQVSLKAEPSCGLTLHHLSSRPVGPWLGASRNFRMHATQQSVSAECRARLRLVVSLIKTHDTGASAWSTCGTSKGRSDPAAGSTSAKGSSDKRSLSFSLLLLVAGGLLLVGLLAGLVAVFQRRLDARSERMRRPAPTPDPSAPLAADRFWSRSARWTPWLVFAVILLAAWDIGYNVEMTAGFDLYPYRVLDSGKIEPAPCKNGLYRQQVRPVLGLCSGDTRRPLLNTAYSSTVGYWPFAELGRAIPQLRGEAMRVLLLPLVGLFLWLLGRLLHASGAPPALTALTPVAILMFPLSAFYATPYLFEFLPLLLLLIAWWLLARWNRLGATWCVVLACFGVGLAIQQKLPYALIATCFLSAYVIFFGLRRLGTWRLVLSAVALAIGPLGLLVLNHFLDPSFASLFRTPGASLGPTESVLSFAHQAFASTPLPGSTGAAWGYLVLLLGLLAYGAWKIRRYWLGDRESLVGAFAAGVFILLIPPLVILYRHNASSSPLLQFLPFPAVLLAAALLDARQWLMDRSVRWGRILTPVLLAGVVIWGGYRWWTLTHWLGSHPAHLSRSEQRRQADQLLEVGVRHPLLANYYYHGVFEFVSRGRLRPIYLRQSFDPQKRKTWDSVLRQTASAPLDVLFSTERLVLDHDSTDREALRRFLEAVAASGRSIQIRRELRTASGRAAFVLVRLAAAPSTIDAKRTPRPSLNSR